MGQAKRRGTFEQRVETVELARQIINKAFSHEPTFAQYILDTRYNGDMRAFANEIVTRQKDKDFYRGWPIVTKPMSPPLYAAERGNEFSPCFKTREEVYKWIDEKEIFYDTEGD